MVENGFFSFFSVDKFHRHHRQDASEEPSKHFWHSVCGLRSTTTEELTLSAAIMSDCIRTYGMSQSDRKNNAVNRLLLLQDLEEEKQTTTTKQRRLKSDPLLRSRADLQK